MTSCSGATRWLLRSILVLLVVGVLMATTASSAAAAAADFHQEIDVTWGGGRGQILEDGKLLTLSLDRSSGSGFQSKKEYLFGKVDMQIKLVAGNSAGTVTTYYLSSQGPTHDEIDFEFLGNLSGEPYTLHTNVFTQGKGEREQQFRLWFDPAADFHTYSVLWNPLNVIFFVDGVPIRVFKNREADGIPYTKNQAMKLYSTIWDAEEWATRGGLVKTDWSQAPFVASYRNFAADACVWLSPAPGVSSCAAAASSPPAWMNSVLDAAGQRELHGVQQSYMIYDYCADLKRFPQGFPPECSLS